MKSLSLFLSLRGASLAVLFTGATSLGEAIGITLGGGSYLQSHAFSFPANDSDALLLSLLGSGNTSASVGTPVVASSNASYSFTNTSSEAVFSFASSSILDQGSSSSSNARFDFTLTESVTYTLSVSSSGNLGFGAYSGISSILYDFSSYVYGGSEYSISNGNFDHQLGGSPDGNLSNSTQGSLTGILGPGNYRFFVEDYLADYDRSPTTLTAGMSTASASLTLQSLSASVPDTASTLMLLGLVFAPLAAFARLRAGVIKRAAQSRSRVGQRACTRRGMFATMPYVRHRFGA